jgi:hypothetical protein
MATRKRLGRRDHAVLSQEFLGGHQSNRRFFSVRRSDGYSQLAPLDEKNRVGRVTLYEGRLILFQVENLPTKPRSREKGLSIENRIAIIGLRLGRVNREGFSSSAVAELADRTEPTDGIRLAGGP